MQTTNNCGGKAYVIDLLCIGYSCNSLIPSSGFAKIFFNSNFCQSFSYFANPAILTVRAFSREITYFSIFSSSSRQKNRLSMVGFL